MIEAKHRGYFLGRKGYFLGRKNHMHIVEMDRIN